jgi:hypothetical protein
MSIKNTLYISKKAFLNYLNSLNAGVLFWLIFYLPVFAFSSEKEIKKGAFKIKMNAEGIGSLFYNERPILLQMKPQPYMRNKNYSNYAIPDSVNVIEEKKDEESYNIIMRGGNPSYMGYWVNLTLKENEVTIHQTFYAYGNMNCVAAGCRYYLPKELIFGKKLKFSALKYDETTKLMNDKLPRWIAYGVKKIHIPIHNADIVIDLSEDKNFWYFQNLQNFKGKEKSAYLLYYENKDWHADIRNFMWQQKVSIKVLNNKDK